MPRFSSAASTCWMRRSAAGPPAPVRQARHLGRRRPDVFAQHQAVLGAIGDQVMYVGPIGAGSVAKLVHNCSGYMIQCALAEAFTMGDQGRRRTAGAVAGGAPGRDRSPAHVRSTCPTTSCSGNFDPPAFALRLAHKDVSLATQVGREHGVPMRMAHLALDELTEALNRGWGNRDSRVAMLLQEERSQLEIKVDQERLREAM